MPDIIILAQAVLQIFCSQSCFTIHMPKSEKGDNSVKYVQNLPKVNQVIYILDTICESNIMILARYFVNKALYGINAYCCSVHSFFFRGAGGGGGGGRGIFRQEIFVVNEIVQNTKNIFPNRNYSP